jgi:hypothetical protein
LAGGISPEGEPTIMGTAGEALTNVLVADFTVTDSAGEPGEKWNSKILWGDGGQDQRVPAVMGPDSVFQFFGTHTYVDPGTYTITVQIAVPGSGQPLANVVTTTAIIDAIPEPGALLLAAIATPFLLQRRSEQNSRLGLADRLA